MCLTKEVLRRLHLKYENDFYVGFGNFISELFYPNISTENRAHIKDLLVYTEREEYLRDVTGYSEKTLKRCIAMKAYDFTSPLTVVTEIPLMVLTNTDSIFMRRKDRLRHLILGDSSSSSSETSSQINPESMESNSSINAHTIQLLRENLSEMTYSELMEYSELESIFSSRVGNIFSAQSSRLAEEKIELRDETLGSSTSRSLENYVNLKKIVEKELQHLIVNYTEKEERIDKANKNIESDFLSFSPEESEAEGEDRSDSTWWRESIQETLVAELQRYKMIPSKHQYSQLDQREGYRIKTGKRVLDKAEAMLKHYNKIDHIF